ncbi:MAG: ABC transporter ATP-binding protein [Candidatus Aminicenantales bacterium]
MNDIVLKAENLGKSYPLPKGVLRVFEGLGLELKRGDLAAIMGASGVGKTTLLNLLGALDRPSEGRVIIDGVDLFSRTEREVAAIRNRKIGFVFQFYHLLPEFSALENVSFPLMIQGVDRGEAFARAAAVLKEVALEEKANSRPSQLSGGEQQRVAIARALVSDPSLLLADEPTGNLDWKSGEMVLRLILDLHARKGLSSIIVTHNEKIARYCHKLYLMEAGELKLLSSAPS